MLKASSPLFAGVFALLFGAVQTARADTIVVTSDVTAATLTEGQSLVVTYTAVITVSDSNGALVGGFISPQVGPSGDLTDILDNVADSSPLFNCVGQTFFIAGNGTAANTCSFRITFIGVQDAVVEDSDSGSATARLGLSIFDPVNSTALGSGTADTNYTVNDPPASVVPEPSSLPLVGSGLLLLGLAGAFRRA